MGKQRKIIFVLVPLATKIYITVDSLIDFPAPSFPIWKDLRNILYFYVTFVLFSNILLKLLPKKKKLIAQV